MFESGLKFEKWHYDHVAARMRVRSFNEIEMHQKHFFI